MNNELYKTHSDNIEDIKNYTDEQMQKRLAKESIEYFGRQKAILNLIENFMIEGNKIRITENDIDSKIISLSLEFMSEITGFYTNPEMLWIDIKTNEIFQEKFEKILRGEDV